MSAWKYEFGFVPATAVTCYRADNHPSLRILSPEREGLWEGRFPGPVVFESLDSLLPHSQMIGNSLARRADGKGNFFDLFFERDRVLKIDVTLDLRVPCLTLVSELTLLANRQQWLVITTDGRIFRPTVRRFLGEIQQSPAMRWIRGSLDPLVSRQATRKNEEPRCD
jgi:hypothetical protein